MPLNDHGVEPSGITRGRFGPGIEDLVILPLVLAARTVKWLCDATITVLVHILDYAFPVVLQLVRFPMFTLRIIGDGIAALLKGLAAWLPMSGSRRELWRTYVSERWAWLRSTISYEAFEEALHHAFEAGMAWVFRHCRTLSPGSAMLVTGGALLWLPVSFAIATTMHAVLIAQATVLPAWMQLLHPVATVIAKTKLLVLPVFPAAWPQTRKHPVMQALFDFYRYFTSLHLVQKTTHRYRQLGVALARIADALRRAIDRSGVRHWLDRPLAALERFAARLGHVLGRGGQRLAEGLSGAPLIGPLLNRYADHYDTVEQRHEEKLSDRMSSMYERWSIKFTPEYYEAKDQALPAQTPPAPPTAPRSE